MLGAEPLSVRQEGKTILVACRHRQAVQARYSAFVRHITPPGTAVQQTVTTNPGIWFPHASRIKISLCFASRVPAMQGPAFTSLFHGCVFTSNVRLVLDLPA